MAHSIHAGEVIDQITGVVAVGKRGGFGVNHEGVRGGGGPVQPGLSSVHAAGPPAGSRNKIGSAAWARK